MQSIAPLPLAQGKSVSIVAPAGPVDSSVFEIGCSRLSKRYKTVLSQGCLGRAGYLSSSDEQRLSELQMALDDEDTMAVIAARGGFGTSRIIDGLDFGKLAVSPKWVVGSSDLTTLLFRLWTELRLQSIHGPMVSALADLGEQDEEALWALLEGRNWKPPTGLVPVFPGTARGPLVGGNLTVMAHLVGTFDPDLLKGAILFLEDVGEAPYRLDRCLVQLRRAKVLELVSGVVLGEFTSCEPGSGGISALEAVTGNLEPLRIPVISGYPAAHGACNYPFVHGKVIELEVGTKEVWISI